MKTSKLVLKILVVLVLAIALLIPSTFSWYNHSGELSGKQMVYNRTGLRVSNGTVSAETKMYEMESDEIQGGSANNVYYDQKGNKKYKGSALTSGSVNGETSQYYGTKFTNESREDAYVNLYLKDFTNSTNVNLGTLQPNLTNKGLSSSVHLTNNNSTRVYFQWKKAEKWKDPNATSYLVYITKSGNKNWYVINEHIVEADSEENPELNAKQTKILKENIESTYYVDLPQDTVEFYFATNGNANGFKLDTCETTDAFFRTKSITNIQSEIGYYLTGGVDDTTWNAEYKTFPVSGGISVKSCFDRLTINNGQHAYVTLNQGTHYTGVGATYALSDGTGITVNANTGLVSANTFSTGGSAEITTTITGSLGDTRTITTNVSNPENIPAATVALNVKVPAGTFEGDTCTEPGTAEVVWYIRNTGTSKVEFKNVYYTK